MKKRVYEAWVPFGWEKWDILGDYGLFSFIKNTEGFKKNEILNDHPEGATKLRIEIYGM